MASLRSGEYRMVPSTPSNGKGTSAGAAFARAPVAAGGRGFPSARGGADVSLDAAACGSVRVPGPAGCARCAAGDSVRVAGDAGGTRAGTVGSVRVGEGTGGTRGADAGSVRVGGGTGGTRAAGGGSV